MASHALSDIFDKVRRSPALLPLELLPLQLHSSDKDFRFMATSDLLAELQKDTIRLDTDTERRVSDVVLQKMHDSAGEISELAVKWCVSHLTLIIPDVTSI